MHIVGQNDHTGFSTKKNRMISEASFDTEDWCNDAENSAFPLQEQITFKNNIEIDYFQL